MCYPNTPEQPGHCFKPTTILSWHNNGRIWKSSIYQVALVGPYGGNGRRWCNDILYVIPCSLSESLSTAWLHTAFEELGGPPHIYLAINTEDSSIVYYKISPGIVKPPV